MIHIEGDNNTVVQGNKNSLSDEAKKGDRKLWWKRPEIVVIGALMILAAILTPVISWLLPPT